MTDKDVEELLGGPWNTMDDQYLADPVLRLSRQVDLLVRARRVLIAAQALLRNRDTLFVGCVLNLIGLTQAQRDDLKKIKEEAHERANGLRYEIRNHCNSPEFRANDSLRGD
jgi:hypothetical protein